MKTAPLGKASHMRLKAFDALNSPERLIGDEDLRDAFGFSKILFNMSKVVLAAAIILLRYVKLWNCLLSGFQK